MTTFIFLITFLALLLLFMRGILRLAKHKPIGQTVKISLAIILAYGMIWLLSDLTRKELSVPMDTPVCFDDWCATVDRSYDSIVGDSMQVALNIIMSNHARGISQKPSEPRVTILDANGHAWPYSVGAQRAYEKLYGRQPGIDHRLELNQSLETTIIFMLPKDAHGLRAIIEEGPWITHLLFPESRPVFEIK